MKLAMAQITLYDDMDKNLEKAISFIKQAQECDLIFFPEIQLSPFFHSKINVICKVKGEKMDFKVAQAGTVLVADKS